MQQTQPPSPQPAQQKVPFAGLRLRARRLFDKLPSPRRVWRLIVRVFNAADEDDVDIVAAGLAFYGLFGLFPTLLALVSLYGLIADPADVQEVLMPLVSNLPEQARQVVIAGVTEFVARSSGRLSLGLIVGLAVLLFSASTAMSALVRAINVAYDIPQRRSFFGRRRIAIGFTLAGIVGFAVIVPIIAALPKLLAFLKIPALGGLPWIFALLSFVALVVLYRYAPDRENPPSVRGIVPGAVVASILWVGAGSLYSAYVKYFANYSSTYGALEGVIALQFWLFISALILLYGAELNAELERHGRD